jgi:hypothetical protein
MQGGTGAAGMMMTIQGRDNGKVTRGWGILTLTHLIPFGKINISTFIHGHVRIKDIIYQKW